MIMARAYAVFLHVTLAVLAVLVVLLALENRRLEASIPRPPILAPGEMVPDVGVISLEGSPQKLSFPEDRETFLLVFTTTCPNCADTWPIWKSLHKRFTDRRFVAIGLDDPAAVSEYAQKLDVDFDIVTLSDTDEFKRLFKVVGVPLTILVGKDQTVKRIELGRLTGW